MSRDYRMIDAYLDHLEADIYPQPPCEQHTAWATEVLTRWLPNVTVQSRTLLDIGCGQGFCKPIVEDFGWKWTGVTMGTDIEACAKAGYGPVYDADMSFLPFADQSFELLFARHVLEHSPMPLLTLMEWWRVAKSHLIVVVPTTSLVPYYGPNHYQILNEEQLSWMFQNAHWAVEDKDMHDPREHRWLLHKAGGGVYATP